MGRYDLERANYEFALAYAPNDAALLNALASSLERLGESEQAAQLRAEAARLRSVPPAHAPAEQVAVAPLSVPRLSSVTVKLPPARLTPRLYVFAQARGFGVDWAELPPGGPLPGALTLRLPRDLPITGRE